MKEKCLLLVVLSPLPLLMFVTYGLLRVCSIQPLTESGMSEFMSSAFFIAGAAVCYFVMGLCAAFHNTTGYFKWLFASGLLFVLAADETFMIHEQVAHAFSIPENTVFAVYGVWLIGVVIIFRKNASMPFWAALGAFLLFCGISQTADTIYGEGFITIFGREIDYEQIFEALGAMSLSFAFSFRAYGFLIDSGLAIAQSSKYREGRRKKQD